MAVHLIIIGYSADNRLKDVFTAANPQPKGVCSSPDCHIGSAIRVFQPPQAVLDALDAQGRAAMYIKPGSSYALLVDDTEKAKPAETYVFEFADRAAALAFLDGVEPREVLAGKLMVLIDAATTRTGGGSPAARSAVVAPAAPAAPAKKSKDSKAAKEPKESKATKKAAKKATEPTKPVKPKKAGK